MAEKVLVRWFDRIVMDFARQLRWSYLPPLMVYFAAGVSGLTAIVGTFFVKEYLGLSAAFLAGLAFWVGIPWALKMPLGHLVDLIWRWKGALIYLGATLIAFGIVIMYGLITHTAAMQSYMSIEGLVCCQCPADAIRLCHPGCGGRRHDGGSCSKGRC